MATSSCSASPATIIDAVQAEFQKEADAIREAFIRELGSAPAVHVHFPRVGRTATVRLTVVARTRGGARAAARDDEPVDLFDADELVDAPITEGAAVDSVIPPRADAFGATVVEEQPKS